MRRARNASRDQGGNHGQGGNWIRKARRAAIYARDGHTCVWCDTYLGTERGAATLDHVRPRSAFPDGARGEAGPHASSNLVTACWTCNASRGTLAALPWATLLLEGRPDLAEERARVLDRLWAALDRPLATANELPIAQAAE